LLEAFSYDAIFRTFLHQLTRFRFLTEKELRYAFYRVQSSYKLQHTAATLDTNNISSKLNFNEKSPAMRHEAHPFIFLTARRYASAVHAAVAPVHPSVCLSVLHK